MSGHSKWSKIKRKKGTADVKRGTLFTKLGKLITMVARDKGGDLDTNFALRMAVEKARGANMPKENIERAIKKGIGGTDGEQIQEYIYEGVGPLGSQFIVKALSDNRNRSASEIRHIFSKHGGSLSAVMWNFELKGVIEIDKKKLKEKNIKTDEFELELIEAGADDIKTNEDVIIVLTKAGDLQSVKKFLEEKGVETESAEIEYAAKEEVEISESDREKIESFIEELEDNEDVGDYYTNVK
ncbi:MAG: YebC/PmpR family DNA-binding transcriptional regulator [bacterium]